MATGTKIEWAKDTLNVISGCTKVSPGCDGCYAMRHAHRLGHNPKTAAAYGGLTVRRSTGPQWNNQVRLLPERLERLRRLKRGRRIFVNSMADLFHKDVPVAFLQQVFTEMVNAPQHQFLILTKRSERLAELAPALPWPTNVWMGVSVENRDYAYRIDHLRQVPAAIRFLSLEPLLGPLPDLDLTGIHWVITGAESGPRARPLELDWVREIRDQCQSAGVPFFLKQFARAGGRKISEPELDGLQWLEYPR